MDRISLILLFLGFIFLTEGCIHTYPVDEGNDPTLVEVAIDIYPAPEFSTPMEMPTRTDDPKSASRFVIELRQYDKMVFKDTFTSLLPADGKSPVTHILSQKIPAGSYDIAVICEPETSCLFDAASLGELTLKDFTFNHSPESEVTFSSAKVSIGKSSSSWNQKTKLSLKLSHLTARLVVNATDLDRFLHDTSSSQTHGETYSVSLTFDKSVAYGFDCFSSSSRHFMDYPGIPAVLSTTTTQRVVKLCDTFIIWPETETDYSLTVTVFNSARMIVSRTSDIKAKLNPGTLTTISGDFLTNYHKNDINVNNRWDGEIIIEL